MSARKQKRTLVPTIGVESWKQLLGDPELHWKDGRSAKLVAETWEGPDGIPARLRSVLITAGFTDPELLVAIPEWVTELPDGLRGSQSDVFGLIRSAMGISAFVIEAKVNESFGPTIEDWLSSSSEARPKRLNDLLKIIGARTEPPKTIRYQLIHRTASAMIEAKRFGAATALMIVQSFSNSNAGFGDFEAFASWLGVDKAEPNKLSTLSTRVGPSLHIGWLGEGGGND